MFKQPLLHLNYGHSVSHGRQTYLFGIHHLDTRDLTTTDGWPGIPHTRTLLTVKRKSLPRGNTVSFYKTAFDDNYACTFLAAGCTLCKNLICSLWVIKILNWPYLLYLNRHFYCSTPTITGGMLTTTVATLYRSLRAILQAIWDRYKSYKPAFHCKTLQWLINKSWNPKTTKAKIYIFWQRVRPGNDSLTASAVIVSVPDPRCRLKARFSCRSDMSTRASEISYAVPKEANGSVNWRPLHTNLWPYWIDENESVHLGCWLSVNCNLKMCIPGDRTVMGNAARN